MSAVQTRGDSIDLSRARELPSGTQILVVRRSDGTPVERLDFVRFAGHYRADRVDAFAVRNREGKFEIRSARQLGVVEDSPNACFLFRVSDNGRAA